MGKNKNFKREERKIGGGGWADQFAALGYTTTVDKDENKVEIPENAFINPYTFIPIVAKEPNRKTLKEALEDEKLYDGYLDCSIETKSSTYVPNTSKKFEYLGEKTEHYFYDFFSYEDLSTCGSDKIPENPPKHPRLPGSEIRGMIRNVYEQLTNSCLSVIDEENLPYKRTPTPKLPALWDMETNVLYMGEQYKAQYRVTKKDLRLKPNAEPKFGGIADIKEATELWFSSNSSKNGNCYISSYSKEEKAGLKKGYFHIGEKLSFENKKNAFIIAKTDKDIKTLTEVDIARFEAVLDRYNLGLTGNHHGYKEYRSVYENMRKQKSGLLPIFYSKVGENIYLSPAMITKEVFESTISSLLRDNHNRHEPCSGDDACFCPACRLFGMVGKGKDKNAVASRLRFTDTEVFENPKFDEPRVPEVLGTPRYSSTEFYLKVPSKELGAELWNYDYYVKYRGTGMKAVTEAAPYEAKLSGRKVYWKGIDKLEDAPFTSAVEKRCREDRNYIKDNQLKMRQAIRALKAGNKTSFRIYFENITGDELGNLLFCINLQEEALNRIGKGKPYGMGAVKTEVQGVNITEYRLEDGEIKSCLKTVNQDEFKYEDGYKHNVKNIIKYLTPLTGREAEIVEYPKPVDKKDGKIYEWFVKNRGTTILQPKLGQTLPELQKDKKYLLKN